MLHSRMASFVFIGGETEDTYGIWPSGFFTPMPTTTRVDVAERPFDEYLTDTARIHALGMSVKADQRGITDTLRIKEQDRCGSAPF